MTHSCSAETLYSTLNVCWWIMGKRESRHTPPTTAMTELTKGRCWNSNRIKYKPLTPAFLSFSSCFWWIAPQFMFLPFHWMQYFTGIESVVIHYTIWKRVMCHTLFQHPCGRRIRESLMPLSSRWVDSSLHQTQRLMSPTTEIFMISNLSPSSLTEELALLAFRKARLHNRFLSSEIPSTIFGVYFFCYLKRPLSSWCNNSLPSADSLCENSS